MDRLVIQRFASIIFFAGGWILAAIRTTLDLIGWSTAPDDVDVAMSRLDQFFLWLLSIPWWVPWGFALVATMWLMWVSWPRSVLAVAANSDQAPSEANLVRPDAVPAAVTKANRLTYQEEELYPWELIARGDAFIRSKTFLDCNFHGPAMVIFTGHCVLRNIRWATMNIDDNLIEVPDRMIIGAYIFDGCHFERGFIWPRHIDNC